jgi:hypothetical protein
MVALTAVCLAAWKGQQWAGKKAVHLVDYWVKSLAATTAACWAAMSVVQRVAEKVAT